MKISILTLVLLGAITLMIGCADEAITSFEEESPTYANEQSLLKSGHDDDDQEVQWDIVTLNPPFLDPGGSASALAEDDSKITLTGSGTFEVDDEPDDEVTGGGTWETFDSFGSSTGSGTYEVTNFVSFHEAPGTAPFPPLTDNIGDPADATAGLVYLTIEYSDGSQGVLVVGCSFGDSPPDIMGGITASKGPVNFWNRLAASPPTNENLTIFHSLPDYDEDDDDDDN